VCVHVTVLIQLGDKKGGEKRKKWRKQGKRVAFFMWILCPENMPAGNQIQPLFLDDVHMSM
jgi:hypothetical protein